MSLLKLGRGPPNWFGLRAPRMVNSSLLHMQIHIKNHLHMRTLFKTNQFTFDLDSGSIAWFPFYDIFLLYFQSIDFLLNTFNSIHNLIWICHSHSLKMFRIFNRFIKCSAHNKSYLLNEFIVVFVLIELNSSYFFNSKNSKCLNCFDSLLSFHRLRLITWKSHLQRIEPINK